MIGHRSSSNQVQREGQRQPSVELTVAVAAANNSIKLDGLEIDTLLNALATLKQLQPFLERVKQVQSENNHAPFSVAVSQLEFDPLVAFKLGLTKAEVKVLRLLFDLRLGNKEIAEMLIVGQKTVESHNGNIYNKLGVANRLEAIDKAREMGLVRIF